MSQEEPQKLRLLLKKIKFVDVEEKVETKVSVEECSPS
ncbi:hypothetical protein A2U01_0034165, partial [Trifolium medium]|nr:hypothetical protein [Trifolium medium]